MAEERMMRVTEDEMWAIHHARLNSKGLVLSKIEAWIKRNGWFFMDLQPAPPKAPAGFQTVHYFECLVCGDEVLLEHVHLHKHEAPSDSGTEGSR